MESWTYASEEKGYMLSDEMDYSLEAFMRSRRALVEWDSKASCTFERDGFISDKEAIKSMEFVDLGFPDLFRRPVHGSQTLEASSCEQDSNCSKKVNSSSHAIALDSTLGEEESDLKHSCKKMNSSTHAIALNSTLGEEESNLKHSGSLVESKCHDSSLIDLKLGRLSDCKDASTDKNDKEGFTFSSIYPSTLAKRARTSSSPTQTPVCQVYGCNMDLSLSKEYHKRHKVCDVHSKTAKVIVNGIEQRFCQQCSRFHLLAEFDDGKRSCRRRLAGHNERRRKPQFDYISGKTQKMLQSCQGTKCLGASLQKRPQFAFQDMYRSSIFYSGKYEQTNQSGNIKFEDESIYSPQLAVPITLGQELSRASNSSSCALSLLSAQSQDLPRYSAGSLISQGICTQQRSDGQVSETLFGVSSADKYVPNESFSCGINSMEVTKNRSIMLSDAGHALQLKVQGDDICQPSDALQLKVQEDDICQPSDLLNAKYRLPPEHGATVDLFQLSSHLQRVEQQRNSLPVKQENEDGCFFPAV